MTTTEKAAQKLKNILIEKFLDVGLGFRVVGKADESGHTTFDIKPDNGCPGDEIIESYGMKVFLDQGLLWQLATLHQR